MHRLAFAPPERSGRRPLLRIVVPAFPAFNVYSRIARRTTALGPICVGTAASDLEHWDVEIIDENNYRRPGPLDIDGRPDHAALQALRPADVVGFYGGLTSTVPHLYELARQYRDMGVLTIAGGQHFVGDNVTEALQAGVEVVLLGEAEETIVDLLRALEDGAELEQVPGLAYLQGDRVHHTPCRPLMTCFTHLPLPDFSLLRYARLRIYPVSWVRGCGMDCEFCTVKGKVRAAPPEHALAQIAAQVEKREGRSFFIVDDLFGQRRQDALTFCRLVEEYQRATGVRLSITVQIRLDRGKDTELLQAMRQAGIGTVAIGFESPIGEELAAMGKRLRPDDMLALTRAYRQAGFHIHGMFIFGYPVPEGTRFTMAARDRVRRFRRFIKRGSIDTVQVLLPVPLPGTELSRRLEQQRRILPRETVGWEYYDGNFPVIEPDAPLTPEEMQVSIRRIMGRFYRFRYMFSVGIDVLRFPSLLFHLHNLRGAWNRWLHRWRVNLMRFGGWIIFRQWTRELRKGVFHRKLRDASVQAACRRAQLEVLEAPVGP